MDGKRCRDCHELKPLEDFPLQKGGKLRPLERYEPRRATCRECVNAAARRRGPRPYRSDVHRRTTYGLKPDEYDAMVDAQGGRCPICDGTPAVLVVDHHHQTGLIRGLLCGPCNRALGHLQDHPDLCQAAARYLRASTSR